MNYVPLAFLAITVLGGCLALAEITPVVQPPRLVMIGRTSGNDGLAFGYLPAVTTPPGPLLTRTTSSDYKAPNTPTPLGRLRPRPARLYNAGRFPVPAAPVFTHQTPTPTTGEQVAIA